AGEQHLQVGGHALDGGGVEQVGVVAELDRQPPPWQGHEAERVVGPLDGLDLAYPEAVGGGDVVVDRVVLEHHDGVEQIDPPGQVAPGLDLGEGDEVEAPGLRLGRLQLAQPPHDVTGAVHVGSHRHRVDEDPGDGVHARQI